MPFGIFPYKPGSASAKALSVALPRGRVIKHENSRFNARGKVIINWGYSRGPLPAHASDGALRVLNDPACVAFASNKLNFFRALDDVDMGALSLVPWTEDPEVAREWIAGDFTVLGRTVLNGHSGEGIAILDKSVDFVPAPVYTKYVKKAKEFRVHVMNGMVIDLQQKVRDPDREPVEWKIRSHENGFIYQRGGVEIPPEVREACQQVIVTLGLDFGALDVIWTQRSNRFYVLEVNTAPGLTGETVTRYATALERFYGN